MAKIFISEPIKLRLSDLESYPKRIDLEFKGVSHGGASYEGRVFINNERANEKTKYSHKSYAGSFFVFGHGGCFGDEGHCDITAAENLYDRRSEHPLMPAFKRIDATKAIITALKGTKSRKPAESFVVTVVPVVKAATDKCNVDSVLRFKELTVIVYD